MNTKTFIINTYSEDKYKELSSRASGEQLHIVDNDNLRRTVVPSYDLLADKVKLGLDYDKSEAQILLKDSDGNPISRVAVSQFISDNYLVSAAYCDGQLILSVKVGDAINEISVGFPVDQQISPISDYLSSAHPIASKVVINAISALSDCIDSELYALSNDLIDLVDQTSAEIQENLQMSVDALAVIDDALSSAILDDHIVRYVDNDNRRQIILGNHDNILGKLDDGNPINLAMVSKWNVADFGSTKVRMNLNTLSSDDVITINDKLSVATTDDVAASSLQSVASLSVALSYEDGTGDVLKTYTLTQGGREVGKIDIPKDLVIESAGVIDYNGTDKTITISEHTYDVQGSHSAGKYIVMIIAVTKSQLWILAKDLVDIYGGAVTQTVTVSVDQTTNKISAEINRNSISSEFLAADVIDMFNSRITTQEVNAISTHLSDDYVQKIADSVADPHIVKYNDGQSGRKHIELKNHDSIVGYLSGEGSGNVNLAMVSKWNIADFGSPAIPLNLNASNGIITINDSLTVATTNEISDFATKDEVNAKVTDTLMSGEVKSRIFNEYSGGGAKIEDGNNNIWSFAGVNCPSTENGSYGSMYVVNAADHIGTRLKMFRDGFNYKKASENWNEYEESADLVTNANLNAEADARVANDNFLSGKIDEITDSLEDYALSADVAAIHTELSLADDELSAEIKHKVWIKNLDSDKYADGKFSDLSVIKMPVAEYHQKVIDYIDDVPTLDDNALYVLSTDQNNAYGMQIVNVAEPTLSDDAATKGYVDNKFAEVPLKYVSISVLSAALSSINAENGKPAIELTHVVDALYNLKLMISTL